MSPPEVEQRDCTVQPTFRVLVRGPRTDKLWRAYGDRAEAQTATARLRAIGLDARVELVNDSGAS